MEAFGLLFWVDLVPFRPLIASFCTNMDLIIMASSKVTSPIMGLTSATRKIIDGANRPVLVIHDE